MNKDTKKWLHIVAFVLVIIGAIDLGLFGIIPASTSGQGFDFLQAIFGFNATLLEVIYLLIGVSGVYLVVTHRGDCKVCSK
ncbi:MAG TPA: DUF378 domain-containing protein [Candidatus Acidoferrales bacterium]|nr:DUF378 domain-containing protein [Candidatus Acidoferrales bacterium]